MAFVLTTSSRVTCANSGQVSLSASHKLKVTGSSVITPTDVMGKTVSGCTISNSSSTKQCTSVTSASGASQKLKVSGQAVANTTLSGSTDGSSPTLSTPTANQTKLKA